MTEQGNQLLRSVLEEIFAFLRRYVAFSDEHQTTAISLWIAHTHVVDQVDETPYLAVTSAEKRSGKSRLLEVLYLLVAHPWRAIQPSEAVLFRKIARDSPTLLLDEVDTIFGSHASNHEGVRALLNAGNRRGTTVPRCVGEGRELKDFSVFCPKVLAGIGDLPDTVADRSIPIRLERRAPSENIARFRTREAEEEATPIRERLEVWAEVADLADATPDLPDELNDRSADAWEPLMAIADEAGGIWPERARRAARALHAENLDPSPSIGVQLLGDIQNVFRDIEGEVISTAQLLGRLRGLEEAPWATLGGGGLSPHMLARRLRPYAICPTTVRIGEKTAKGYRRRDFEMAWTRYLPNQVAEEHQEPSQRDSFNSPPARPINSSFARGVAEGSEGGCDGVTDEEPAQERRSGTGTFRKPEATEATPAEGPCAQDPLFSHLVDPGEGVPYSEQSDLVQSPLFGEVWVVCDAATASALSLSERHRRSPRPVVTIENLGRLRPQPRQAIAAALQALAAFRDAEIHEVKRL